MTALLRVNTLFKCIISEPMRWLAGKGSKLLVGWSIVNSAEVLDLTYEAMLNIAADGSTLLDPLFDPFAKVAAEQSHFATWRSRWSERTVKSPDGTAHRVHQRALAEARSPAKAEGGNAQATKMVVELAEKMANAALAAMRDPRRAIADKLTSQVGSKCRVYRSAVTRCTCRCTCRCTVLYCTVPYPHPFPSRPIPVHPTSHQLRLLHTPCPIQCSPVPSYPGRQERGR
jgi:hypothetical protein